MNPHPDQRWGNLSYAQHFDDVMLVNIFEMIRHLSPSYLDLGAHHPFNISNTAKLYERGSRGVNIEANPNLIKTFYELRPEDKNVNCGVSVMAGQQRFYMFSETSGRNTFSLEEVHSLKGKLEVKQSIVVDVRTVNELVFVYCNNIWPDILLTDLEGMDFDVLASAKWTHENCPKVVVTESRPNFSAKVKVLMKDRGYFCYCRMGENLFFIKNKYHDQVY